MINEEISKEVGEVLKSTIIYTINANKDMSKLHKTIREKMSKTLSKAEGSLKNVVGSEMKLKELYKKGQLENINIEKVKLKSLKRELNKNGVSFSVMKDKEKDEFVVFFQAKDIKVMDKAFKKVILKEKKKEKSTILEDIKKYKEVSKNKEKAKEKAKGKTKVNIKDKLKTRVKPSKDFSREL